MGLVDTISTLAQVPTLLKLKKGMKPRPLTDKDCFGARVEANASRIPSHSAIVCEGNEVTWSQFNAIANRYAHTFLAEGMQRGDVVSVFMENRIEFLATLVALNKLGVTAGLINTNLTGRPLTHCVSVTESKKCIFGEELCDALDEIKADLNLSEGADYYFVPDSGKVPAPNWSKDIGKLADNETTDNPTDTGQTELGEIALYIFTSGTTGLPKAAVMSNRRYLAGASLAGVAGLKCDERDRVYLCLPLYHTTGLLIGAGSALTSGASMFIRRKFSASNFLKEVREHNCTCFVYIGELCRYLTNTEAQPNDHANPLRAMMGNGMRPDVWMDFKRRFGIDRIVELYGASEGNVAFANLFNKDCTVGMTSSEVALVQYDVHNDQIVRDTAGRCILVEPEQPGLLLGKITEESAFEGYTDSSATEGKILRNALADGDAWFNTGDLMKTMDVGFTLGYAHYQFVDRVGDTFRWKSENVSTNEVGEIVNGFEQVKFCNIYGVEIPKADGRAGMAAITLNDAEAELDLSAFSDYVRRELPNYAIPVFLRVQPDIDVTGTFKMLKGDLREQAYNIADFDDPVYVLKQGATEYSVLDGDFLKEIQNGTAGY
jgi:citronellyl-CoA synthetase